METRAFELGLGVVLQAKSLNDDPYYSINQVQRAIVQTSSSREKMVIKPNLPPDEILREFYSACIAYELGLPVPAQYLVFDAKTKQIFYGCQYCDYPDLGKKAKKNEAYAKQLFSTFSKWKGFRTTIVFDELIHNVDRHLGNILWAGDQDYILIDHGLTFGATLVGKPDLNLLITFLEKVLNSNAQVSKEIEKCRNIAATMSVSLADETHAKLLGQHLYNLAEMASTYGDNLKKILDKNRKNIDSLLSARGPTPTLELPSC